MILNQDIPMNRNRKNTNALDQENFLLEESNALFMIQWFAVIVVD